MQISYQNSIFGFCLVSHDHLSESYFVVVVDCSVVDHMFEGSQNMFSRVFPNSNFASALNSDYSILFFFIDI